jgi:hypothetical protein
MAFNLKGLITDAFKKPVPQYFNPSTDQYEPIYGSDGASLVKINGRKTALAGKTNVTTAGTPVSLGDQACGEGIILEASDANTGNIYIFPSAGAKTDVKPLAPGCSTVWPISNISALKVDADVSGDGVYWKGAI